MVNQKIINKLCEIKECLDSLDSSNSLETINETLLQILMAINDQPQIEGIHLNPVCFNDSTSGFVGIKFNEVLNTYETVYFDSQYQIITSKPIVPCPENNIQLGPPIEVCTN